MKIKYIKFKEDKIINVSSVLFIHRDAFVEFVPPQISVLEEDCYIILFQVSKLKYYIAVINNESLTLKDKLRNNTALIMIEKDKHRHSILFRVTSLHDSNAFLHMQCCAEVSKIEQASLELISE